MLIVKQLLPYLNAKSRSEPEKPNSIMYRQRPACTLWRSGTRLNALTDHSPSLAVGPNLTVGAAMVTNRFYDLDEGYEIQTAIRRGSGDEIVFDFWHSGDEQTYTVTLTRNNGSLFTGVATSREAADVAQVTCRVFVDSEVGDTIIYGAKWKYPDNPKSFQWLVRLEG